MFNRKTKPSLPAPLDPKVMEELKMFINKNNGQQGIVSIDLAAEQDGKKLLVCTVKADSKAPRLPKSVAGVEVVITEEAVDLAAKQGPKTEVKAEEAKPESAEQESVDPDTSEAKPSEVKPKTQEEKSADRTDAKTIAWREEAAERLSFAKSEAVQVAALRNILEQQREESVKRLSELEQMREALQVESHETEKTLAEIRDLRRQLSSKYEQVAVKQSEVELARSKAAEQLSLAEQEKSAAEQMANQARESIKQAQSQHNKIEQESEELGRRLADVDKREAIVASKEAEIDEMLEVARQQRQMSIETLKSVKDNKSDAERLARAAERQVTDLEQARQETIARNEELNNELERAREETERSVRLKMINEAESKMISEYEADIKARQAEIESKSVELEEQAKSANEQQAAQAEEIIRLSSEVEQHRSEIETRDKKIEILESQIADKDLAQQEQDEPDHSDRAGELAKSLAEKVRGSEAVKQDPSLAARAQITLKDLVAIIEGQQPAEIVLNGAEQLIGEL